MHCANHDFKIKLISGTHAIDEEGNLLYVYRGENIDGKMKLGLEKVSISDKVKYIASTLQRLEIIVIDTDNNLWSYVFGTDAETGQAIVEQKTPIMEGTKFKSVAVGERAYTMAIDMEGNLWAWGDNKYGQLGDGTTVDKTTPIQIKKGTKFQSVSAGYAHTMAIDINGNLWGWGYNRNGQLGDGTVENKTTPIQIKAGTKFTSVSTGNSHTMAIDVDGNLWGLGNGSTALQTGSGTTVDETTPNPIMKGTKFISVSAPEYMEYESFITAIDNNGNLWMWGYTHYGDNLVIIEPTIVMQLQK